MVASTRVRGEPRAEPRAATPKACSFEAVAEAVGRGKELHQEPHGHASVHAAHGPCAADFEPGIGGKRHAWRNSGWLGWAVACTLATSASVVLMSATGQDDSHMTFWAARALADHGGILNYGGHRVEQSSSLLFTLLLSGLYKLLPVAIPTIAYLAGIALAALGVWRVAGYGRRLGLGSGVEAPLAVATSPLLCYWMLSGMETTLVAWLYVEFVLEVDALLLRDRNPFRVRTLLVAFGLALVRPETSFVCIAALGALLVAFAVRWLRFRTEPGGARRLWHIARLAALVVTAFACVTLFRLSYFGAPFPQPVSAKTGPLSWRIAESGLHYLWTQFSRIDTVVLLIAFAVAIPLAIYTLLRREQPVFAPLVALGLATGHGAFVVSVGGDWMAVGRFAAFAVPVLYMVAFDVLRRLPRPKVVCRLALSGLVALNAVGLVKVAMHEAPGRPIWAEFASDARIRANSKGFDYPWVDRANQTHTRDILFIGEFAAVLDELLAHQDRVVVMSGQAGMVMYYIASRYFGRVEFIDRHGLTGRHLMPAKREAHLTVQSTGLAVTTERFFQLAERRPRDQLMPDVVFDLSPDRKKAATNRGFVCVYEQTGRMSPSYPEGPGPPDVGFQKRDDWFTVRGSIYEFIAVRGALANLMRDRHDFPRNFTWNPRLVDLDSR